MRHHARDAADHTPVAIGGVGGSGTRLVANLLQQAGFHLGDDLNDSSDTLWFTLLFKRQGILEVEDAEFDLLVRTLVSALRRGQPLDPASEARVHELAAHDRPQHPAAWLRERTASLLAATGQPPVDGPWGWKEPNTHVVIERLWRRLPDLRYVHVVRNGLDMAYSSNQNQLRLWGNRVLGADGAVTPARSLAYWCHVHRRMRGLLGANAARMYWLDYDALCLDPDSELPKLCAFLGHPAGNGTSCRDQIHPPRPSRRPDDPAATFAPDDLAFVHSLGYR